MSVEVTTESWGSRLGNSFKGVIVGGVLFLAGIPLLFWNEGRAVKTAEALEEGEAACVEVKDITTINRDNEGHLVHMTGMASTQETLMDPLFNCVSLNAIRLTRKVEYYQWVESSSTREEKNVGGSTTKTTNYSYSTQWSSTPVDSSKFNNPAYRSLNTVAYPVTTGTGLNGANATVDATMVNFGAFMLSPSQISKISGNQPVPLANVQWPADLTGRITVQDTAGVVYIGHPVGYVAPAAPGQPVQPGMQPGMQPAMQQYAPQLPISTVVNIPDEPGKQLNLIQNGNFMYVQASLGTLYPAVLQPNGTYMVSKSNGTTTVATPVPVSTPIATMSQPVQGTAQVGNMGMMNVVCAGDKAYICMPDGSLQHITLLNGRYAIQYNGWQTVQITLPTPGQPGMAPAGAATATVTGTANPAAPVVGDVRITWTYVPASATVSLVAKQTGNTFTPYTAENGYKVDLLQTGTVDKAGMFADAHASNNMMTWIWRFVGWLMMFIGLKMIFKPLSVLGDVLPILGNILEFGTGIIAFLISAITALVVIAIAWLFYRPVIGIILLVLAIVLLVMLIKKKKAAAAAK